MDIISYLASLNQPVSASQRDFSFAQHEKNSVNLLFVPWMNNMKI